MSNLVGFLPDNLNLTAIFVEHLETITRASQNYLKLLIIIGKYAYDVTLKLDANGILTVTEVERHTGKKAEMEIAQARERYSQRDLQAMINDMERFREKDRLERERIDLKQEFELYLEEASNWVVNLSSHKYFLTEFLCKF